MDSDQATENLDHPSRPNAPGDVDRIAFTGPLINDRQALERLPIREASKTQS